MDFANLRDDGYLGGSDVHQMVTSFIARVMAGPRFIRQMDNQVNLAWYNNRPWYRRMPGQNQIIGLRPQQRSNFIYANLAFESCRTLTGVMHYPPVAETSPQTDDQEDIARAHVAADVSNGFIESQNLSQKYHKILTMAHMFGHAWIKTVWNPQGGIRQPIMNVVDCPQCHGSGAIPTYSNGLTGCTYCGAQGATYAPLPPGKIAELGGLQPQGDVAFICVNPDDLLTDPDADSPENSEQFLHVMRLSPEAAWETYGKPYGIPFSVFETASTGPSSLVANTMAGAPFDMRSTEQRYIDVREFYSRPTEKHPRGIFAVLLGDVLLSAGSLPYLQDDQFHPFFYFPLYESPNIYYPMSTLDLILPLVITFNEHLSLKNTRAKQAAKLRMMYEEQSRMRIDEKTGNLIYKGRPNGARPEPLAFAPYPPEAEAMQQILLDMIDRISGATEVVRGQPPDTDSARALTFLEERAVGPLKPVIGRHAKVLDSLIKYGLDICRLFYDDGRIIRRRGVAGGVEVMEFRSENIGENTDVQLRAVRDVGRSRASKAEELKEMFNAGAVDAETYMSEMEYGDTSRIYEDKARQRTVAMQEDQMLLRTGNMPMPTKYQDHRAHKKGCHQKTLAAIQMVDPMDQRIQLLIQHMDLHSQLELQESMEAQGQMIDAAGAYGAANAANPEFQPDSSLGAAEAAQPGITTQTVEPYSANEPSAPGQSPAFNQAVKASANLAR